MKTIIEFGSLLGVVAALTLGACATPYGDPYGTSPYGSSPRVSNREDVDSGYGVVSSIERMSRDNTGRAGGIGLGTIAGAVVGGVVGNQVGSGSGNTAATVIGAAGGAYVGHELEKRQQAQRDDAYKVTISMDDGSYQSMILDSSTNPSFRVGDRVRIRNGVLQRY
ncbi:glycine zipper 2TM domain-containing protein [Aromatoleum evansii]|uniref:glycine zipper 2TM domain-containing protein n=1 Tax=Aromatoleum evansii TaxID=59406 RepID=UPI00145C8267|nr:glycine zipper 2TM domain-containing protein [Aromatoleum evansii]NMG29684.1 glycine zipper 2TM domain-containing protein [Aromatoleum evansii]